MPRGVTCEEGAPWPDLIQNLADDPLLACGLSPGVVAPRSGLTRSDDALLAG